MLRVCVCCFCCCCCCCCCLSMSNVFWRRLWSFWCASSRNAKVDPHIHTHRAAKFLESVVGKHSRLKISISSWVPAFLGYTFIHSSVPVCVCVCRATTWATTLTAKTRTRQLQRVSISCHNAAAVCQSVRLTQDLAPQTSPPVSLSGSMASARFWFQTQTQTQVLSETTVG